jgi:hypothetical protein
MQITEYYDDESKTLLIPCFFNEKITNIPKKVKKIIFQNYYIGNSRKFNQPIDNLLINLTHLTHISLGDNFNQTLKNLPENLIYIKLGKYFNSEITIPKSVKKLVLTYNKSLLQTQKILNNLPHHIETLGVFINNSNEKIENLPITLKKIVIYNKEYEKCIKIPYGVELKISGKNNSKNYNINKHKLT